jgi:hypothetical protein
MASHLAFMTMVILHEPFGHPRVQGFLDRLDSVYDEAAKNPGFIARSVRDFSNHTHSWGKVIAAKCFDSAPLDRIASTLSTWTDLESVAAFAYSGLHGESMTHRRDWFEHRPLPTYVAWWIEEGEAVNWEKASARLDHLHDHGSSAYGFTFKEPFDSNGQPTKLDSAKVKARSHR